MHRIAPRLLAATAVVALGMALLPAAVPSAPAQADTPVVTARSQFLPPDLVVT